MFKITRKYILIGLITFVFFLFIVIFIGLQARDSNKIDGFILDQLSVVRESVNNVDTQRSSDQESKLSKDNIEKYQSYLSDSLGACRKILEHIENKIDDPAIGQQIRDYNNKITSFCKDYIEVSDYAYSSSKATRQVLAYDPSNITNGDNTVTELREILGYTKADLEKLKTNPVNDPALQEQLTIINDLLEFSSMGNAVEVSLKLKKVQINLVNARDYYWVNTIDIDGMNRSINNLINQLGI